MVAFAASETAPPGSVPMRIINHAGAPIEIYWINVFQKHRPLVKQTTKAIRNNTETEINSYNTHSFVVKFLNPIPGVYAQAQFTKGPKPEVITVSWELQQSGRMKMFAKQVTKYDEILTMVNNASSTCSALKGHDKFGDCFAQGFVPNVIKTMEAKSEIVKYRNLMADRLRNYTCADHMMESSKTLSEKYVKVDLDTFHVKVLFENEKSRIWTVDKFISDEECKVLETHARPLLRRATVAAEDGTSIVSENRKAQQASYNLHQKNPNDPLAPLLRRTLSLTNAMTGYDLHPPGQEGFTVIQYNREDQYSPHCDGSCTGELHNAGGRVATAVIYCRVADRGGATTFTKADIFVKPKKNQATFFSYKGPDGHMDDGFTEHSGCPVELGEKWITTAWMREGVSAENSWEIYDPSGVPIQAG